MNLTHLDELEAIELQDGFVWRPVRRHFGIRAFGVNAYTPGASRQVVEEHTEQQLGHEEIYLVLRGRVRFTIGDDEHELGAGQLVFVRDPSLRRAAVALGDDAAVLAVGGKPGEAHEVSAWEYTFAAAPHLPHEGVDEKLQPERDRERLVRLLAAERDELLLLRQPGDDVAPRDGTHRGIDDDRVAAAAGNPDRKRVRPRELGATRRVPEPARRGRSQHADQAAVREAPDVVPEHPCGERPLADEEPCMRGRLLELDAHDAPEHEIADGATAVPALESVLLVEQPRLGRRVVALEPLEPRNPRVAVSLLPASFGRVEVPPQLLRVGVGEAERTQPAQALAGVHASLS